MDTANVPKFTGLIGKVEQISTNKSVKSKQLKSHLIIKIYNIIIYNNKWKHANEKERRERTMKIMGNRRN